MRWPPKLPRGDQKHRSNPSCQAGVRRPVGARRAAALGGTVQLHRTDRIASPGMVAYLSDDWVRLLDEALAEVAPAASGRGRPAHQRAVRGGRRSGRRPLLASDPGPRRHPSRARTGSRAGGERSASTGRPRWRWRRPGGAPRRRCWPATSGSTVTPPGWCPGAGRCSRSRAPWPGSTPRPPSRRAGRPSRAAAVEPAGRRAEPAVPTGPGVPAGRRAERCRSCPRSRPTPSG